MTVEERDRLNTMEEEYRKILLVQDEEYKQEREEDDHDQWRINGISLWEL